MRIEKQLFYCFIFLVCILTACQEDEIPVDRSEGDHPIILSGISTKGIQSDGNRIYIRGNYINGGVFKNYFMNTLIEEVSLDETPTELKLVNKQHYPIGDNEIHLFGFTNNLSADGLLMNLRAGEDELLANYGTRSNGPDWPGISISPEGRGAIGSSSKPVETLFFRHVMTQINVKVEVADNGFEGTPASIAFEMPELVTEGTYPITAKTPIDDDPNNNDVAIPTNTGKYRMSLGTNYVVPTGEKLTGQPLSHLEIDHYIATPEDLDQFRIGKPNTNNKSSDLILLPGYAYNLVFKVNRLKVTGIHAELTEWKVNYPDNDEISFIPAELELYLNDYYSDLDNDPITKVILYTEENQVSRQYVGEPDKDGKMMFTILPKGKVTFVDLYTRKGLLAHGEVNQSVFVNELPVPTYKLNLQLGANGMFPENTSFPPGVDNPYLVTTPAQFIKINKKPDGHYKQTADFEMEELMLTEELKSFGEFTGSYDGQGYRINRATFSGPGIFTTNRGTIKNIRISSGTFTTTTEEIAGVICQINEGLIEGCVNEARMVAGINPVNEINKTVGGICGKNGDNGTITGCINTGNIETGDVIGGICGENTNTADQAIFACINTGRTVYHYMENDLIGGLCGKSSGINPNAISYSYWLNGSAAHKIGGDEYAAGNQPTTQWQNVADVSPAKLQDKEGICKVLNDALDNSGTVYKFKFVVDGETTGSVWPIPVKQ